MKHVAKFIARNCDRCTSGMLLLAAVLLLFALIAYQLDPTFYR